MGHEVILQVSKKPIKKQDYFVADDFYYECRNVIGSGVDYIRDMSKEEMKESLEWLEFLPDCYSENAIKFDAKARTMTILSKEAYFKQRYEKVKQACQKIIDDGFDAFAGTGRTFSFFRSLNDIEYYGNDRYGLQISEYAGDTTCIDTFIREANDGDVYYFGAVIDFHM